ncbi:MAG: MarR family transcriptional regulator [Firmicutes bacterium]|nr:MarR family transcriptional regulator [Bacillota bacterium]
MKENLNTQEAQMAHELVRAMRHFNRCQQTEPADLTLKPKEMMLLYFLQNRKRRGVDLVTLSAIGEELRLSPPSITLLLNPLEKREFLRRVRDGKDRRVVFVEITEKGQQKVKDSYDKFLHNAKVMVNLLGYEDMRTFLDLMKKLTTKYREYNKAQKALNNQGEN